MPVCAAERGAARYAVRAAKTCNPFAVRVTPLQAPHAPRACARTGELQSLIQKNLSLAEPCALRVTPCRSHQDPYTLRTCPPNSQGGFI